MTSPKDRIISLTWAAAQENDEELARQCNLALDGNAGALAFVAEEIVTRALPTWTCLVELEGQCLSIGEEFLPYYAIDVLDGKQATHQYWFWLLEQFEKMDAERTNT